MSVLVFVENWDGKLKKASYEVASYGARLAAKLGTHANAVVINATDDTSVLGKYGIETVYSVESSELSSFNNYKIAEAISTAAKESGAKIVVLSGTFTGKMIAPLLAVHHKAALITNVVADPDSTTPLKVKRSAFSNKGYVYYESLADTAIISIVPNALGITEHSGKGEVKKLNFTPTTSVQVEVVEIDRAKGKIPLPEAEIVVSAGRGLKGPENWGMIEELAEVLGASTACSKPVSDMHWRPHSEHVGQTGITINPQLYIAVGISGAIQHLAGVSGSKTIVVINSDPEAPFFKAADYGVVGDAFKVVPALTEAIRKYKAQ
ncbi:MAG: electron transfer flavoprotein subunit alpha/FixB family protein [Thermaurantimonas sp.]|uniref:electron transfer flavoprotein subunit alpha/FixB family protein n=1 Tax=Thermaurantimonas sp. TaxID=2681568 RepID=UPI00391C40D2